MESYRHYQGVCTSLCQIFVVKEQIILKRTSFITDAKYWSSASIHFAHLSGKLWIPCQKNCFLFCGKTFVEPFSNFFKIAEVLLCKRVFHWCEEVISQMPSGQKITAGVEGCPIQAISRCLSPVLMRETGHCRVTKSLGPFRSFFDQCVIQINHCWWQRCLSWVIIQ